MALHLKLPPAMPALPIRAPIPVLVALFQIQLPARVPRKEVDDSPNAGASATHRGDPDGL